MPSSGKCQLPAEEITNTARGTSDNSAQTVGWTRRKLVVPASCKDARSIAEARRCRNRRCRFENKSIPPCHLNNRNQRLEIEPYSIENRTLILGEQNTG